MDEILYFDKQGKIQQVNKMNTHIQFIFSEIV